MTITSIEETNGKLLKIYIDYEFEFALYPREISVYSLEVGEDITADIYETILRDTVLKRAVQRAVDLIARSDKSEQEIRSRLDAALFSPAVTDKVVEYLYAHHFLDDSRMAESFIRIRYGTCSNYELKRKLMQKGISKDVIDSAFETVKADSDEYATSDIHGELQAALNIVQRKLKGRTSITFEEKQKIMAALYRKGFGSSAVTVALDGILIEREEYN